MHTVSVIVPTRALAGRAALLRRALDSVFAQQGVRVVPIVVINGPGPDPDTVRQLTTDSRLRVVTLPPADYDLPAALLAGRNLVDTPWFSELDDDDLLLPTALAERVNALEDDAYGAAISNGLRRNAAGDVLHIPDASLVERDPIRALPKHNWLLPGSWLCRTDAVPGWIFEGMPPFLECTYLALRLATHCRVRILAQPGVIWHTDTPIAVTRSREYVMGQVTALQRILQLDMPADVRTAFRTKMSLACHGISDLHLQEGAQGAAWDWHLRSLAQPGGLRYLAFTLKLLRTRLA
jgi:glycosyltransferase involved in cell wall biosynthesis